MRKKFWLLMESPGSGVIHVLRRNSSKILVLEKAIPKGVDRSRVDIRALPSWPIDCAVEFGRSQRVKFEEGVQLVDFGLENQDAYVPPGEYEFEYVGIQNRDELVLLKGTVIGLARSGLATVLARQGRKTALRLTKQRIYHAVAEQYSVPLELVTNFSRLPHAGTWGEEFGARFRLVTLKELRQPFLAATGVSVDSIISQVWEIKKTDASYNSQPRTAAETSLRRETEKRKRQAAQAVLESLSQFIEVEIERLSLNLRLPDVSNWGAACGSLYRSIMVPTLSKPLLVKSGMTVAELIKQAENQL